MYQEKRFLAIIPARGGSKGLPGKNIRNLCGKPLIAWSIDSGLKSKYIDRVMVTTDDKNIANIAKEYGADVPFLRPNELATDTATSFDALTHTIDFYKNSLREEFDYIVLLEPTSPLRDANDIDSAIEKLLSLPSMSSIVGVSKTESQNPAFLVKLRDNGSLVSYEEKEIASLRRQEIEEVFYLEGTVYISEVEEYISKKTFYHENTASYEVPKWKALEVDDIYDFEMIKAIMKYKGI